MLFGGELAGVAVHVGHMQVRFDLTHRILRFWTSHRQSSTFCSGWAKWPVSVQLALPRSSAICWFVACCILP